MEQISPIHRFNYYAGKPKQIEEMIYNDKQKHHVHRQ